MIFTEGDKIRIAKHTEGDLDLINNRTLLDFPKIGEVYTVVGIYGNILEIDFMNPIRPGSNWVVLDYNIEKSSNNNIQIPELPAIIW